MVSNYDRSGFDVFCEQCVDTADKGLIVHIGLSGGIRKTSVATLMSCYLVVGN